MTVKKLIEILQRHNPEAKILVPDPEADFENKDSGLMYPSLVIVDKDGDLIIV